MQGLGATDLLNFARCSRALAHAADNPFAWLHARVNVRIDTDVIAHAPLAAPCIQSVGRHARISARVGRRNFGSEHNQSALAAVMRVISAPLHELHLERDTELIGPPDWTSLPTFVNVCVLDIQGNITADTLRCVAKLPRLHTLKVARCAVSADVWQTLPELPSLTSLDLVDLRMPALEVGFKNSCLQYVRQCSKLTHLGIWSFALQGTRLGEFLRESPQLCNQLRSLRLVNVDWSSAFSSSSAEAFSLLANLHSLDLYGSVREHVVLLDLVHAPSLRFLRINQTHHLHNRLSSFFQPPAAVYVLRHT